MISSWCCSQEKFLVRQIKTVDNKYGYQLVDEKGNIIKELDRNKYIACFNTDQLGYFAIFAMKNESGWIAINKAEDKLFKVYNTSFGEPSPDELVDKKIRIVDEHGRIGFANEKGQIVITPQFEMVSEYYKGKAIIGESCEKIPWEKHQEEHSGGCHHYSISCTRNGYINGSGKIIRLGNFTFAEIADEIKWKSPYNN